jgi:hypothetical protein
MAGKQELDRAIGTRSTNTAIWDLCCYSCTLVLGARKASCGEHEEDGNGLHFWNV